MTAGDGKIRWENPVPVDHEGWMGTPTHRTGWIGTPQDGVSFTLVYRPTCYRRGPFCLQIEVASGRYHDLWGCFDGADQPVRYFHKVERAVGEASDIAEVLWKDRVARDRILPEQKNVVVAVFDEIFDPWTPPRAHL